MRTHAEYAAVLGLIKEGLNDCEIGRLTGIPRRTVLDWRHGRRREARAPQRSWCERCGHPEHTFDELPTRSYAYLLGMYLGDGVISLSRTWRLRITLDMKWPGIVLECSSAMQDVFPENRVKIYQPDPNANCVVASVYSRQLPCHFPQHGKGPKHLRRIGLAPWQQQIVVDEPERFLRGLIHSDGCRFINRVRIKDSIYAYPRYNFTNASDDIRGLFTATCDQLGIEWRQMNARNVSIARRASVARLDGFVGPKY